MSQPTNESLGFVDPFPDKELLTGQEAAVYVAAVWGFEEYTEVAFRGLVFRRKYKPDLGNHASSYYDKEKLKRWPKPDKSRPRGKRLKRVNGDEDEGSKGTDTSVLFKRSVAWSYACEEAPDFDLVGARG